jgi:hypothetical protein
MVVVPCFGCLSLDVCCFSLLVHKPTCRRACVWYSCVHCSCHNNTNSRRISNKLLVCVYTMHGLLHMCMNACLAGGPAPSWHLSACVRGHKAPHARCSCSRHFHRTGSGITALHAAPICAHPGPAFCIAELHLSQDSTVTLQHSLTGCTCYRHHTRGCDCGACLLPSVPVPVISHTWPLP